jgi:flagellar basal-body rod protein FlgG
MQNGYYQAVGAMATQFHQLEITSNNLANVNTSGFKRDAAIVGSFERLIQEKRDEMNLENHTQKAAKFFNRTINHTPSIVEKFTNFSSGTIKLTGNSLDFALKEGDLFFAVDTPQGVKLTQQSSFVLDEKGFLSTKDGYKLLSSNFNSGGERYIQYPEDSEVNADKSGNLYKKGEKFSAIYIGRVENLKELKKEGDNLYALGDKDLKDNITPMIGVDVLSQGSVVMSNVNAVNEMVSLIESNRLVEMYQKVMTSHMDDLNRDMITKIAPTRA